MADSESFGIAVVEGALANAEDQQVPLTADILQNWPTMTAMMGNTARRGGNTLLKGGYGFQPKTAFGAWRNRNYADKGSIRRGIANNNPFNLMAWNRYRDLDIFEPGGNRYTPFSIAQAGNYLARGLAADQSTRLGRGIGRLSGGNPVFKSLGEPGGTNVFTQGMYSRVTAAAKIGRMSDARYSRLMSRGGLENSLRTVAGRPQAWIDAGVSKGAAQRSLLVGNNTGRVSGYVGGFLSTFTEGAQLGGGLTTSSTVGSVGRGSRAAMGLAHTIGLAPGANAGLGTIARSTMSSTRAAGLSVRGARVAGSGATLFGAKAAFMAVPYVNVAMTGWMAYDLAKVGVKGAGAAVKSLASGVESFVGDPMFRDSEAAMTSRARGVAAIQKSRLNARSVLGSEASVLASHF